LHERKLRERLESGKRYLAAIFAGLTRLPAETQIDFQTGISEAGVFHGNRSYGLIGPIRPMGARRQNVTLPPAAVE